MIIFSFSVKTSRCCVARGHTRSEHRTGSHNLSLFFLHPPRSLYLCLRPGILNWPSRLCHINYSAWSFSLGPRSRFNWAPCFVSLRPLCRSTPLSVLAWRWTKWTDFVILHAFSHQLSGLGQDLAELCFCICFRCLINYQADVHSDFIGIILIFSQKIASFRFFFSESDLKKFSFKNSMVIHR